MYAIDKVSQKLVELLVKENADVNTADENSYTPLITWIPEHITIFS